KNTRLLVTLGLGILLFILLLYIVENVSSQETIPNVYIQYNKDNNNNWYMTCIEGCGFFNRLGTPEELTNTFLESQCIVNWYYALFNRWYGHIALEYLVGPNGDTSNPLCQDFLEPQYVSR